MGTREGCPCPPALWLRRAKPEASVLLTDEALAAGADASDTSSIAGVTPHRRRHDRRRPLRGGQHAPVSQRLAWQGATPFLGPHAIARQGLMQALWWHHSCSGMSTTGPWTPAAHAAALHPCGRGPVFSLSGVCVHPHRLSMLFVADLPFGSCRGGRAICRGNPRDPRGDGGQGLMCGDRRSPPGRSVHALGKVTMSS